MRMKFPRTVYAIQHNVTGRIYVGSSANIQKRYWGHIWQLRNNKHQNKDMQYDFNEYGEDYSLFVLDKINDIDHKSIEQLWMKKLRTNDPRIGYNKNDPYFRRKYPKGKEISDGVPIPNTRE